MTYASLPVVSATRTLRALSCGLGLSIVLMACGGGDDSAEPHGNEGAHAGSGTGKSGSGGAAGSQAGSGQAGSGQAGSGQAGKGGASGASGTTGGGSGTCGSGKQQCAGACTDLQTDVAHCGSCDRSCAKPGTQYSCEAGQCVFKGCAAGFGDCNGKPNDGCEFDLKGAAACPCQPGQTAACYDGPAGTEGVGVCHGGMHSCKDDGSGFGACGGQVTPQTDGCADDLDQDCNGVAYKCTGANQICGVSGTCADPCDPGELGTSYIGCVYYPTITPNLVTTVFDFAVAVSNTNPVDVTATVTRGASTVSQVTVAANSVQIVILPWIDSLKGPDQFSPAGIASSVRENDGAYKLVTSRPVTVYQYSALEYQKDNQFSFTNDASLLLPTNAWRNDYVVTARANWQNYSGFYAVVASQDNTTVTVTPGAQLQAIKGGIDGLNAQGSGSFVLNEGDEVLVIDGGANNASDLTGSRIKSDKPIQVISGHECTNVPADIPACDHLEESMFPVDTLSNEYLVVAPILPSASSPKANIIRFVATDDGTALTYDPMPPGAPASLGAPGSWVEFQTDQSFQVKGTKRFALMQYMLGQQAGGDAGDPAMAQVVTTDQYRTQYLFHAPISYSSNFVNITAPTAAKVTLDGAPIPALTPIGGTGYGSVRVSLPSSNGGNHTITGDLGFGISVYGYGQYTSYWYPGGLDLREIKE